MNGHRLWSRRAWLTDGACALAASALAAQQPLGGFPSAASQQQQTSPSVGLPPLGPEMSPEARAKQEKLQNDDRQKRLVADTEKLLTLATQLHADVEKTDKYVLSLDVIRRCEEIDKLSRAIRDRMRG